VASDSATIDRSVLLRQWFWPLRLAFWVAVIGTMVWAIGMLAQAGWAMHRQPGDPLSYQIDHLEGELKTLAVLSPLYVDPVATARFIGDTIHRTALGLTTLFARTLMNIPGRSREFAASHFIREHPDPGNDFARTLLRNAGADWDLLVLGTYGFAVRTGMYAAMVPILLLTCGIGLIDGWVMRARRRASAGRESSSIYHRAKLGATSVLITGYMVCLTAPDLQYPTPLLLSMAVLVALLMRLQLAYYKKYL
jgi:hypothetical protein